MEKVAAAESQARRYYENQLKSAKRTNAEAAEVDWCFGSRRNDGRSISWRGRTWSANA